MKKFLFLLSATFFILPSLSAQNEAKLMRFPAIGNNSVVFSYAGDLYTVPVEGGVARRLTSDIGYEVFPRFSPDGKSIAFTGQFDGNTEVYLMPSEGGTPERLTHTAAVSRDDIADRMGPNNVVMAWSPDGKEIVYRGKWDTFSGFKAKLYKVSKDGGLSEELPLSEGGFCSFSPDGKQLAMNRVFREFRTWKYYKGGMADDIWIFDFATKQMKNITNNDSQDIFPMWIGDEIFFLSDRDRTMNLFVYNTKTESTEKLTAYTDYDIKFPSASQNAIVFERNGELYKFDVASRQINKIPVYIENDVEWDRPEIVDASKYITAAGISPDGERVVLTARGEVFSLPAKEGVTRNLTKSGNANDRYGAWSPDGKYIAYISDIDGESEIYIVPQDGSAPAVKLTSNADTYKQTLRWSPDGKKIFFTDRKNRLQYVDVATKSVTLVAQGEWSAIAGYDISPDNAWVAYTTDTDNRVSVIYLYNMTDKERFAVTDNWYNSSQPMFSQDGKYLYIVSARDLAPAYASNEWNAYYGNQSRIYAVMLSKDTPSPVAIRNNEVGEEKAAEDNGNVVKVDKEGIGERIVQLPVSAGSYSLVYAPAGKLYYATGNGRNPRNIKLYDFNTKKTSDIGEGISLTVSANGKKALVREGARYAVVDLPNGKVSPDQWIDLSDMKVLVDYSEEWQQIFDETWRVYRDFFYVENMHGVDWKKIHDKYAPLVPYVRHRNDLTYVIGEMIAELNIGHAYVNSGQRPEAERINTGLLGARFSKDKSGFFRIEKIFEEAKGWNALRSPLKEYGADIKVGDYIVAINGTPTNTVSDIYSLLIGRANKNTEIAVNTSPSLNGARKVVVLPIDDESGLKYYEWVMGNVRKVDEASNGEIGYIHIPDMSTEGLNAFVQLFYPQLNKKALIIDDRMNGGGNVSPIILERLGREAYRLTMSRNIDHPEVIPNGTHYGPKVCLIDKYSASDGDLFPYGFRKLGLGKLIGVRTWGGVVGISASAPYMDGQDVRVPFFTSYSIDDGNWIIEGHGVDPDIEVDNNPADEYLGKDDQLMKAVEVLKEELKSYRPLPPIPAAPDKSK